MNHAAVLSMYDRRMRQDARPDGPGVRIERVDGVVRQTAERADGWHGVLWADLTPATADAAIAEQIRYFTTLGRAFEWKLYAHDRPACLADRLRAAGFVPEPTETLMAAETRELPTAADLPAGVRLEPVTDAAGVDLMAAVHERAFGPGRARFRSEVLDRLAAAPETVAAVVAMAGDTPVSAARMELPPDAPFATLWGGGTDPAWRGRGIYRALIAHRARIAAARGYPYLQVDASDQSRPILQRLGFAPLTTTTPYVYTPGAAAAG
ncbi:GNAT family N-acetyltransferase [Streptomyces purpurogeneiscleroticus]|uniref:GNAT family N-acetyltransferase n=1 Tax=Streptomyces purpurogeneiscleroticus TaxID=68259 RepID=UPI001CBC21C2|nr:GNAT family N-acetyltransferase [Streptomyces purpurogeneiscleroticus]MBZ4016293.1 GNAT family N-acetyltransferase [Streptomyces purpurogeneiscleroticus]